MAAVDPTSLLASGSESYALITGASKGLGAAIAVQIASGFDLGVPVGGVVLVARSGDVLRKLKEQLDQRCADLQRPALKVVIVEADLSKPSAAVEKIVGAVQNLKISLLVNCAGLAAACLDFDYTEETQLNMELAVNVQAPMLLTRAILPKMIATNEPGRVLNVASLAAFYPAPFMATYSASKAWMYNWSMALTFELRKTLVTVSCYCPGHFHSDFDNAAGGHSGERGLAKSWSSERDINKVAIAALKLVKKQRRWGTNSWFTWIHIMLVGIVPASILLKKTGILQWVPGCRPI